MGYGQWNSQDWARVVPLVGAGVVIGFWIGNQLFPPKRWVNYAHSKNVDKVVNQVDVEEIGEKKAFCRCWRSKNFPYCDGSHCKHNEETGDNAGPLIITNKKK